MSKLFVVLFAGCMNADHSYTWYYNDLNRFGKLLSTMNGVDAGTLTVLHSDGSRPFRFGTITPKVMAGTVSGLLSTLQSISASATTDDRFIFVASNHGGADGTVSYLWCWDEEPINAARFAQACSGLACRRQAYIFGQCYSGGFIPALAGSKRVILTGADSTSTTNPSNGEEYTEFLMRVADSLDKGERRLAYVFATAKAADAAGDRPQLSDPGGVGSDASLLNGP